MFFKPGLGLVLGHEVREVGHRDPDPVVGVATRGHPVGGGPTPDLLEEGGVYRPALTIGEGMLHIITTSPRLMLL